MKFLDTNVFVYFVDDRDPVKQARARLIIAESIESPRCMISGQVLNEFANVALKKGIVVALLSAHQRILLSVLLHS